MRNDARLTHLLLWTKRSRSFRDRRAVRVERPHGISRNEERRSSTDAPPAEEPLALATCCWARTSTRPTPRRRAKVATPTWCSSSWATRRTGRSRRPGRTPTSCGPATYRSTVSYTHLRAHETPEHLVCR